LVALAALSGCSKQVSYEPAPLTEVPPGGDESAAPTPSPRQAGANAGASLEPKSGELPIDCATLGLVLPDSWTASAQSGTWTFELPEGTVTVSGTHAKASGPIKGSDLVTLARGPFGAKGVTQVRADGTVAGKGRSAEAVEWRLAKGAAGSTQVVVIAYQHPGKPVVAANETLLDKAVGRATLGDIGTC
jgi:hypothetical protein